MPARKRAPATVNRPRNRLLAALPPKEYARVAPSLERVVCELRQVLFDVDQPIEYVYFPEDGVMSIVGVMADGTAVETATVGHEGMIGLPVFHGTDRTSAQAFTQVPGVALRMESHVLRAEVARQGMLTIMLHRYTQALFTLIAQSSACNRVHSMRERCARWLLHTHDRVGADEFPLTHHFLSQMLGVRRATVTEALGSLHDVGAVDYEYGRITLRDRAALEGVACECYMIIRREFDRLLGPPRSRAARPRNPLAGLKTSDAGKSTAGDGAPRRKPRRTR